MVDSTKDPHSPESTVAYWELKEYARKLVEDGLAQDRKEILAHIDSRFNELRSTMLSAFPADDPVGHKAYHIKQMEFMEERAKLYKEIRSKTLIGLVWLGLAFMGTAAVEHIRSLIGIVAKGSP